MLPVGSHVGIVRREVHLRHLQVESHTAFATLVLLMAGLAGCASELSTRTDSAPPNAAPFVGVFTGEFVDGKPLYRFPTIEVVGSRRSIGPGY
jgi:hypothetical protein